jgi:dihydropteroate synthase
MDRAAQAADAFIAKIASKPLVMGILNVTPDSFSDGGRFNSVDKALMHARAMAEAGADIIDIGAESTRPGFIPVDEAEEWRRLEPLLTPLLALGLPLSIDTSKACIARRAAALGAALINDVTGLRGDPDMAAATAESGAALVIMHHRQGIQNQEIDPALDIVADMLGFFETSLALAEKAGVRREKIVLDPGVGFGKSLAQNLRAVAATHVLRRHFALPVLIGVSRKRFLGALTGAPTEGRLAETLAANLAALARGAAIFRVHDVAEHVAAFKVWTEIAQA